MEYKKDDIVIGKFFLEGIHVGRVKEVCSYLGHTDLVNLDVVIPSISEEMPFSISNEKVLGKGSESDLELSQDMLKSKYPEYYI